MSNLPGSSQAPPIVPDVVFNTITDMTACDSGIISWSTTGDPTDLTLVVTISTDGNPPYSTFDNSVVVATNINPTLDMAKWSPVNVTQGNYVAVGIYNDLVSYSSPFFVANGTDMSCLSPPPPPASSSDPGTTSASTTSGDLSGTGLPVTGAISSGGGSDSHAGAIAGGVIGGVVLILLILLGVLFFLRLRRRSKHSLDRGASAPSGGAGKWNGLASRDSNIQSVLPTFATGDRKAPKGIRRQSAGASSTGHGGDPTSPVASDEDLSTLAEEEKIAHANGYFNTTSPVPYTGHRRSSTGSNLNSPITPLSPAASTRSSTANARAAALAKLDPNAPPKSPYARRQSLDGRVLSSPPPSAVQTPVTATAEMIPMGVNRTSSGPRRATRKPVPTYNASEVDVASTTVSMERERSTSSGGHGQHAGLESATTLGSGIHAPAKASRDDVHSVAGMSMTLSHKSSFGDGRPMHYLIPDMPPPQRDD